MLDFLNDIGGIVVAVIASFTAFKLYNHKQQQTKKYEVYESLFESINKLNRYALQAKSNCNDMLLYEEEDSNKISEASKKISEARNELVLKRHLVYIYTSPSFINEFKRFEHSSEIILEHWDIALDQFKNVEYDIVQHIEVILEEAKTTYDETERLITLTRNIVDHDLRKN